MATDGDRRPLVPDPTVIDPRLREQRAWLCRRGKVPVYAKSGRRRRGKQGSPEDLEQLVSFDEAREVAIREGYDGVGLALTPDSGIAILDFDKCVSADGVVAPEVAACAQGTYWERSLSGSGVHVIYTCGAEDLKEWADRKSPAKNGVFGTEVFRFKSYVAITGDVQDGSDLLGRPTPLAPVNDNVRALCAKRFGASSKPAALADDFTAGWEPRLGLGLEKTREYVFALDSGSPRDVWLPTGQALHHEGNGSEEYFQIWHDWSEGAHNYTGEEGMRYQWERFRETGAGRPLVTMRTVLKMAKEARAAQAKVAPNLEAIGANVEALKGQLPAPSGVATPDGYEGRFKISTATSLIGRPRSISSTQRKSRV